MKNNFLKVIKYRPSIKMVILVIASFSLVGFLSLNIFTPSSYIDNVDNGSGTYIQEKTFGEISLMLKHKPAAYFACKEVLDGDSETNKYSDLKKEYISTSNYTLRIEALESPNLVRALVNDQQEYQAFIEYLSFGIRADLELHIGEEIIPFAFTQKIMRKG